MSTRRLVIDGHEVTVTRKRIKSLRLRIASATGALSVSAPAHVPEAEICAFVRSRKDWIRRHQERLFEGRAEARPGCAFSHGETVPWLGETLRICIHEDEPDGAPARARRDGEILRLHLGEGHSRETRRGAVLHAYAEALCHRLPERLAHWQKVVGRTAARVEIRNMKSRWGSCTPRARSIRLNLRLMAFPEYCLDYVIVHELTHLHESGHTPRFWRLVAQFQPDWRRGHEALRAARLAEADWQ